MALTAAGLAGCATSQELPRAAAMTRRFGLVVVFACALAGCASGPVVRELRDTPTGIGPHEEIALLLTTYGQQKGQGQTLQDQGVDTAEVERFLDDCVRREMLATHEGLRLIPARGLREVAFPGAAVGGLQLSSAEILAQLTDGRLAGNGAFERLRYVVLLDGTHWESGADPAFAVSPAGPAAGAKWQRALSLRATVLDLGRRRVAGSVSTFAQGSRGAGVGVLVIIPFPYYYSALPDAADLCRKLGPMIARFIVQ